MNLMCGVCACILALWGYFHQAYCFILAGAVFDVCDGALARLLNTSSELGKELDSLSDLVTFGLAPALMLFTWHFKINCEGVGNPLAFVPLLLVAFSAIRLARFNTADNNSAPYFNGLATPASAMIGASVVAYGHCCTLAGAQSAASAAGNAAAESMSAAPSAILAVLGSVWFIPVLSAILCVLLVSRIPMFSLKGKLGTKHYILAGGAALLVAAIACTAPRGIPFVGYLALFTFLLFCLYILLAIVSIKQQ